jgi:uncharacterized protein
MQTKKLLAMAVLAALPFSTAWADELTAAKKADLRTLVEMSGAKNLPIIMANAEVQRFAPQVRQLDPKFPDKGFQIMRDQMAGVLSENADKPNGLFDQLTNTYHNNFSHEEIKEILKFQQSPTGRKLSETQGKIGQENMQIAGKWASQFAPEVDKRMKEALTKENLKLPDPPKPAPGAAKPAQPAPKAAEPAKK